MQVAAEQARQVKGERKAIEIVLQNAAWSRSHRASELGADGWRKMVKGIDFDQAKLSVVHCKQLLDDLRRSI